MKKEAKIEKKEDKKVKIADKKQAIFMFVCGFLVGAIVTTGIFLIVGRTNKPPINFDDTNRSGFNMRERPNRNNSNRNRQSRESNNNEETKTEESQNN